MPTVTQRFVASLLGLVNIRIDRPVAPYVHEEDGVRCLRFNDGVVQSAMQVEDPIALNLSYTRAMMGFLLFHPVPQDILIVGLGGGSLPKFCYHRLPTARITTLEIDPAVIALRDAFEIPPDNERFLIVPGDACTVLTRGNIETDVILLDGYDAAGLPDCLCSETFYDQCHQALRPGGVLAVNLWGGEPRRVAYLDRLRRVFNDRVWWCKPRDSSSLIVLAVNDAQFTPRWSQLVAAARALDAKHRLNLMSAVEDLRTRPDPGL